MSEINQSHASALERQIVRGGAEMYQYHTQHAKQFEKAEASRADKQRTIEETAEKINELRAQLRSSSEAWDSKTNRDTIKRIDTLRHAKQAVALRIGETSFHLMDEQMKMENGAEDGADHYTLHDAAYHRVALDEAEAAGVHINVQSPEELQLAVDVRVIDSTEHAGK